MTTDQLIREAALNKIRYPGWIIFYRIGDFYLLIGDDARLCESVLGLTAALHKKGEPDEMLVINIPCDSVKLDLRKLTAAGHWTAIGQLRCQ